MATHRIKLSALVAGCLGFAATAWATQVEISDLRTPSSPAFVLLGVEPASVERPTDPKALATSLFTAVENGGNFAIEVAPYWLMNHPDLTFDKYYRSNVLETIRQTLSISAATALNVENASGTASTSNTPNETGAGAALRFSLLKGTGGPDPRDVKKLGEVDDQLLDLHEKLIQARQQNNPVEVDSVTQQINQTVKDSVPIRQRIGNSGHLGFTCDVAAGTAGVFPSGQGGQFTKTGAWITPGYRSDASASIRVEFLGVARYLNDQQGESRNLGDFGARILVGFNDLLLSKDLNLSFEGLRRFGVSNSTADTERFAGIIEYELPEFLQLGNAKYVHATFGQDFDQGSGNSRVIALLGLNFSFGQNPEIGFAP